MFTTESFHNGRIVLHGGDCRDVAKTLPDNSLDSMVTDTPYALESVVKRFGMENAAPAQEGSDGRYARLSRGFMGHTWDTGEAAHDPDFWREWYRVLKPGAFVAAMGGDRTFHRLASALEDARFEIRHTVLNLIDPDSRVVAFMRSLTTEQMGLFLQCMDDREHGGLFAWMYGTGFPKSHDVPRAIDGHRFKMWLDADPRRRASYREEMRAAKGNTEAMRAVTTRWRAAGGFDRQSGEAFQWEGWGTALKPAFEPIVLARKPLSEETVAANVLRWRTGALNIDGCRVDGEPWKPHTASGLGSVKFFSEGEARVIEKQPHEAGRWPANVVHDGSVIVVEAFPESNNGGGGNVDREGEETAARRYTERGATTFSLTPARRTDSGSASRFFYSAKAADDDRAGSKHPTVKPIALKQWLVRLVTPPGGITVDPFAGTGTTGEAALREGVRCIMAEREAAYLDDIRRRMGGKASQVASAAQPEASEPAATPEPAPSPALQALAATAPGGPTATSLLQKLRSQVRPMAGIPRVTESDM